MIVVYFLALIICYFIWAFDLHFKTGKKDTVFLWVVLFAIILTLRPDTFPDTTAYSDFYNSLRFGNDYGFSLFENYKAYDYEFGFLYLMLFFHTIGLPVRVTFFVLNLISNICIIKGFRMMNGIDPHDGSKSINVITFLTLYYSYYGVYYQGIALRSGLTISLGFLAVAYWFSKKKSRCVVLLIVAFTIQKMAIMYIPIILIISLFPTIKNKKKYMFFLCITFAIYATPMFSNLANYSKTIVKQVLMHTNLTNAYSHYLNMGSFSQVGLRYIFYIFIAVLGLFFEGEKRDKEKDKLESSPLVLIIVGLISIPFLTSTPLANRIYDYFMFFSLMIVYKFVINARINKLYRAPVYFISLACYSWLSWSIALGIY